MEFILITLFSHVLPCFHLTMVVYIIYLPSFIVVYTENSSLLSVICLDEEVSISNFQTHLSSILSFRCYLLNLKSPLS